MSGSRSDAIASLRRAIARIEEREAIESPPPLSGGWRRRLPLGAPRLDRLLGGGLKPGALYEIAPASAGDQSAAAAFCLALALRFARMRAGILIWAIEDVARGETGAPYGPGLEEWGLDLDRLVLVRAADAPSTLWTLEEALKRRSCAAVVGELWSSGRRYGETAARRLAFAARSGGAPCLLLHSSAFKGALPSQGGQARLLVSAAPDPTRRKRSPGFGRQAAGSQPAPSAPVLSAPILSAPLPGPPRFVVQVLRARLAGATAFDPHARNLLAWTPSTGLFRDVEQDIEASKPDMPAHRSAARA